MEKQRQEGHKKGKKQKLTVPEPIHVRKAAWQGRMHTVAPRRLMLIEVGLLVLHVWMQRGPQTFC